MNTPKPFPRGRHKVAHPRKTITIRVAEESLERIALLREHGHTLGKWLDAALRSDPIVRNLEIQK